MALDGSRPEELKRGGSGAAEGGLAFDEVGDSADGSDAGDATGGGEGGRGRRRGGAAGARADVGAVGAEEDEAVPEAGRADTAAGLGRVFSAFPVLFFFEKELHFFCFCM